VSTTRYTADIDLANHNDSHTMAIYRVPARSNVLDIGAADGSVASVLQAMDCRVWGVEIDEEAAATARNYCEEVIVSDVEAIDFAAAFNRRFDVVLLLDVLEHLKDPAAVLQRVAAVLDDDGWVVVSLPNVSHGAVRLQLLEGRFNYTELGLLDKTHLRFFDRPGVDRLFTEAGYEIVDVSRVTRAVTDTEIPVDPNNPLIAERLAHDVEAETYQFIVLAAPIGSPVLTSPPVLPAMVLAQELAALRAEKPEEWLLLSLEDLQAQSLCRRQALKALIAECEGTSGT
jgi:2-polyprenyl-3-methyl-5-hydroxy-6-metoxy-1,4-benzoquinol methylase